MQNFCDENEVILQRQEDGEIEAHEQKEVNNPVLRVQGQMKVIKQLRRAEEWLPGWQVEHILLSDWAPQKHSQ